MTCLCLRVGVFSRSRLYSKLSPITRIGAMASLLAYGAITAAFAANKITVRLEGEIEPECAIQGGTASGGSSILGFPLELGDISQPGRKEYGFVLNCNAPFSYRLEAQYGALTNTSASAASGFTGAVPYEVAMRIPTQGVAIEDRCTSGSIQTGRVSCRFTDSGNDIALRSAAQLTITWQTVGKMPIAGAYVERLTIKVAASL
jgi:hypothetical protein